MTSRASYNPYQSPVSIYEMHLGSWKLDEEGRLYTYERMADEMPAYVKEMGYTHVELLPVMEHPLDLSWGYQVTGYCRDKPLRRSDGADEADRRLPSGGHRRDSRLRLPAHFPKATRTGLLLDGAPLYESANPLRSENEQWGPCMFDFGRNEVRSFLRVQRAVFWLDVFHADGLRVDAVSYTALRLRPAGGQVAAQSVRRAGKPGGHLLLREINEIVYRDFPGGS